MDVKAALKGQYHAGLAMLRNGIEQCPSDLWEAGEHPRTFWRIAYHVLFYTHLYLMPEEAAFEPWARHRPDVRRLWTDDSVPPLDPPYTQGELLEYLDLIDRNVDAWVDALDLSSPSSGFSWYSIPKLDHQILNVRHLGVHVGQLEELLMARGIDNDWVSMGSR